MRVFKLYPEERHWWSFADYQAVLETVERLIAQKRIREGRDAVTFRVLEFGPGSSTLSLIEGGATTIDSYEDADDWYQVYAERLGARFPEIVRIHRYTWRDPIEIVPPSPDPYDLAFIDGPLGTLNRPAVLRWCVDHVRADGAILIPTEEIAYGRGALRPHIDWVATERGLAVEWMQTGPLSGAFALLTKAVPQPRPVADFAGLDLSPLVEGESPRPATPVPPHRVVREGDVPGKLSRRARRKAAKQQGSETA